MALSSTFFNVPVFQFFFKLDSVYESTSWIFKNNQLVSNDAVNYFFLLVLLNVINVACLVQLCLAPSIAFLSVEHLVNVHFFFAAAVVVH